MGVEKSLRKPPARQMCAILQFFLSAAENRPQLPAGRDLHFCSLEAGVPGVSRHWDAGRSCGRQGENYRDSPLHPECATTSMRIAEFLTHLPPPLSDGGKILRGARCFAFRK